MQTRNRPTVNRTVNRPVNALSKSNCSANWTAQDIARINASWAGNRTAVYFLTNQPIHAGLWARVAVKFARKVTR